jgi:hypothetical protein
MKNVICFFCAVSALLIAGCHCSKTGNYHAGYPFTFLSWLDVHSVGVAAAQVEIHTGKGHQPWKAYETPGDN